MQKGWATTGKPEDTTPIRTKEGYRIAEKAGQQFLRERIRVAHHKKTALRKGAEETRKELARSLEWEDYDNIMHKTEHCTETTFLSTRNHHIRKFNQLKEKQTPEQQQRVDQQKWVCNLSSRILTDAEARVLR